MKEIKAFIKPFKLNAVMLELSAVDGLAGLCHNCLPRQRLPIDRGC